MLLIRITVISAVLTLAACGSSNDASLNSDGTGTNATTTGTTAQADNPVTAGDGGSETVLEDGSITLTSSPSIVIESLPEVITGSGPDGRPVSDGATTAGADTPPSSKPADDDAVGSGTTGGAVGSTAGSVSGDAGASATDGGSADAGFADAGVSDAASDGGSVDAGTSGAVAPESVEAVSSDIARPPSVIIDIIEPDPVFQAGSLTAADYDDQLNPHLYQTYASDYLQTNGARLDVPYLDLSNRIGIHVTDQQGLRYGGVRIDITDANGQIISLETPASGITYVYNDLDKLPEQFTIRASGRFGTAIDKTIDLAQVGSGNARIDIVIPEDSAPAAATRLATGLDIMFVIDTTGSMGDELDYIKTELKSIINAIPSNYLATAPNIGLTFYRDKGDDYVVRANGFNNDISSVQSTLNNETHDGGGDYPEAMDQALHEAIDANWQQDSHKILFLIADAPPHDDKMRATWNAAEQARAKNIHIVPVAASGVGDEAEYLMRSIAAFTNSRYLFLTDDSGYGNPHAEPKVDCYVVTQLNNMMIRVINSLIAGERQEPTDNEIIRTVGNYDKGVCEPQ